MKKSEAKKLLSLKDGFMVDDTEITKKQIDEYNNRIEFQNTVNYKLKFLFKMGLFKLK